MNEIQIKATCNYTGKSNMSNNVSYIKYFDVLAIIIITNTL